MLTALRRIQVRVSNKATLEQQPQGMPTQAQGSDRRRDEQPFGDTLGQRRQEVFRIGLLNCGGLKKEKRTPKNEALRTMVLDKEFHVLGVKLTMA